MRILRILLLLLCLNVAALAMATKPSGTIVAVDGKNYYLHTVKRGDTLYSLSKSYGVTTQDIIDCNQDLRSAVLKADSKLLIPFKQDEAIAQPEDGELQEPKQPEEGELQEPKQPKTNEEFLIHTIKSGDTLYSIASKYKISMATLEEDNPEIVAKHLTIGSEIKVRRAEMGYASKRELEKERRNRELASAEQLAKNEHMVKPGETLYYLSRRYGISEDELLLLNNIESYRDIKAGMKIIIAPATESEVVEDVATTELVEDEAQFSEDGGEVVAVRDSLFVIEPLDKYSTLKMALMLPFHARERANSNYVDFYKGVLLALSELKSEGISVDLSVFDTKNSAAGVQSIVDTHPELADVNLIVGPVHEVELKTLVPYAEENNIVVVSPLADLSSVSSPLLFQMQADSNNKYDKLAGLMAADREVIVIYAGENDVEYLAEIEAQMNGRESLKLNFVFNRESFFYNRNADGSNGGLVDAEALMRTASNKTYVVVASKETDVDRILTTLSSLRASIGGRSLSYGEYVVIGNRKWQNMKNIDSQSFFKNNVVFFVPYHAKRNEVELRQFDSRYIENYGTLPTMFSYRGYDAAMIFCRKMFTGIDSSIEQESFKPLLTTYRFKKQEDGGYVNTEWTREAYKSNFTINVE